MSLVSFEKEIYHIRYMLELPYYMLFGLGLLKSNKQEFLLKIHLFFTCETV